MEKLENRDLFVSLRELETVTNATVSVLMNLSKIFKMSKDKKKYSNKVKAFYLNKKFHECCNKVGISSIEERQKILDDIIYDYICSDMYNYNEIRLEITYLISMLGANINKKNEETGLSPYDYIQNSTSIGWFKRQSILRDLESLNPILEETREIIEKPIEFFNQNLSLFIEYIRESEEQQNTARNSNTLTSLPEGIFSENFEREEIGAKTCKCLLI